MMRFFLPKLKKSHLLETVLGIALLHGLLSSAEETPNKENSIGLLSAPPRKGGKNLETLKETEIEHNVPSFQDSETDKESFTINFNNISIIEYIRFVSKITNLNFVFNEADLQFNVTIVSEDPVTPRNILSILIQVLRIHNLAVLEQESNLIITTSRSVSQIAAVVSSDLPEDAVGLSPVVTRVFRIKNANLNTISTVIKPMLSESALIEVSNETKQLIVTDITTNVDKISQLLASLDTPHSSLEIDSYVAENVDPGQLIALGSQIISPFAEGNPLIFVPQTGTKTIFIVSTPHLIERTLTVFEDLDLPSKEGIPSGVLHNIFLYKLEHKTGDEFLTALDQVGSQLKGKGASPTLIETLQGAKFIKESNSILFVGDEESLARIKELVPTLDTLSAEKKTPLPKSSFLVYKIEHASEEELEASIDQMADNLSKAPLPDQALIDTIHSMNYLKETHSLIFTGDDASLKKLSEILPTFDLSSKMRSLSKSNFLVYKILHASQEQLESGLSQMAENLSKAPTPDQSLIDAIHTMHYLKETNSVVFTGDDASLKKLSEILPSFDISAESLSLSRSNFLVYKILHTSEEQLENSLNQMAQNLSKAPLPDQALIDAIHSMKYIKETNSVIFTGNNSTLAKLAEILPTFDVVSSEQTEQFTTDQFFIYHPKNQSGEELKKSISEIAENLKDSGLSDPAFLLTVDTVKWISSTHSLIFTGTPNSLKRVQEILEALDSPKDIRLKGEVFLYKPKHVSSIMLQEALEELASHLDDKSSSDASLQETIESAKKIEDSQSILFRADPTTLKRLQELIVDLDTSEGLTAGGAHTFYLYKLQYASGDLIENSLNNVASNLKQSRLPNQSLIQTIQDVKWIKENNSLLLTGSQTSIEQTKKIIEQFDIPSAANQKPVSDKSSFYIYKPSHQSPEHIQNSLGDLSKDLEASGLIDTDLLSTLNTMRYVEATRSLLFTGSPASLEKVKELISRIDVVTPEEAQIQQLGQLTFLIYKIQHVPAGQLLAALKGLSFDLQNSGAIDSSVSEAINSMKYIKETNSVLFIGSTATLQKVELMVKKFDIPSLAPRVEGQPPGTFVIYTPKFQPGDELISILEEFEQNLVASGLANPNLFNTINNLKWIPKTCSILISGDQESITKVEDLLHRFDTPSQETLAPPSIESIENTSFLIYKLQYHQGSEILTALKQISVDVAKGSVSSNQNLLNAVNSLQWIKVTNSLLGSGEPETLSKLKDLIQNLDIPLRQVFIEVLVLETSLTNTQNFGLQWGGKMQYLNRFATSTGNFPLASANSTPTTDSAATGGSNVIGSGINAVSPTAVNNGITPANTAIPFLTGFDLGVIGDIIMHKGRSFISLGSLVNALQTDTDSQIVMNPKIITQDNRNSTIFVGSNIPFIGSLVSNTSTNTVTSQNLEYRDIGFNLSITPTIGNNDIVTLEINNDISEVISSVTQGTSSSTSLTGLTTSHTAMNTRVHVPDKHFVVLSGMIQDSKSHFKSQIPCLGGIPVIGVAFSETDRLNSKQNVLIFVRPHIVNTYEEYKEITSNQEVLFKEQAGLSILKEEIDAGIDMVKTPENE